MKKKTHIISLFAGITTVSLLTMEIVNKFIFKQSTKKESLYRESFNHYNWRFGKISYTKKGTGTSILLIHDLSSFGSSYEFKDLENKLSETNTVYTLDLIGCGLSDKPNITYTNYLYVQLILDFINNVIGAPTVIVTSNRSCSIGIMACYIDSKSISQLLMINPTDITELAKYPKRKHKLFKAIFGIPIVGTFIYNMCNTRSIIDKKFDTEYLCKPCSVRRYKNACFASAHVGGSSSKNIFTSILCHYTNNNIIHALEDFHNPIHIIAGSNVPDITRIVDDYIQYDPHISVTYITETKEMPHIEKASECANELLKLI